MPSPSQRFSAPAPLVALAGWILPGLGYWLVGQRLRGSVIGVTILLLFLLGILFGGIRVIDVPGYDDHGQVEYVRQERSARNPDELRELKSVNPSNDQSSREWIPLGNWRWALLTHPMSEIGNKLWFVPQVLTGPVCLVAARASIDVSHPVRPGSYVSIIPRSHARIAEIGTLYTAVAGMLNLLAIIDGAYRAGQVAR